MITTTTKPNTDSCKIPLSASPLSPVENAIRQHLTTCGYAVGTQQQYVSCIAHLAHWMSVNRVSINKLGSELVASFVAEHLPACKCPGQPQRHPPQVRAALRLLLRVLDENGIILIKPSANKVDIELDLFDAYLRDQRGMAANTRYQRQQIVGDLLRYSLDGSNRLRFLDQGILRAFIAERLGRWSPASLAVVAGALRAFLRYRALKGDDVSRLLPVINSPACWKLTSLPETISGEQIELILKSFRTPLPSWRRGAAVAQCVARLGLRSSEVVSLELEDLNWSSGTLRLKHCKSRRDDVLPMPKEVGAAIVEYLYAERPVCTTRRVFVRSVAPVEVPLRPSTVGRIIRDAYQRCNLPFTRVHIFRHSLAKRVLDGGGTLKEVADVLRHRSLDTAQIYAKLDDRHLAEVAMAWPGEKT